MYNREQLKDTKPITVIPSEFREVARVFIPKTKEGLGKFEPRNQFYLSLHYDPTNKLYFVGTYKHIYPYFYSTSKTDAIEFAKHQINRFYREETTVMRVL